VPLTLGGGFAGREVSSLPAQIARAVLSAKLSASRPSSRRAWAILAVGARQKAGLSCHSASWGLRTSPSPSLPPHRLDDEEAVQRIKYHRVADAVLFADGGQAWLGDPTDVVAGVHETCLSPSKLRIHGGTTEARTGANDVVRRARCRCSVGVSPTRQLSFQPVAIEAAVEATKPPEPSIERTV
jgi:hypothetical protein